MKKYNLINDVCGWISFLIAAVTYLLTIEPTASFWDCPEFIVQGTKLEVGHPPGNPIFMLTARFFVTLFGGGISTAAIAVNSMSALLSAATILLLFWTVTHLSRRLMVRDCEQPNLWQTIVIMAAGFCGALAYTWSDTFWFSAVEGEVYAFSSFCTALVIWLMLKWENRADQPGSDRYLLLIAYVIGVSIAVHLLNLLCIPALALIYYYRKFKNVNAKGSLITLAVSCVLVGAILYGLVPGFVQMAQWFELIFVNGMGMSYNMGVLIYAIVLVSLFCITIHKIYHSDDKNDKSSRLLTVACIFFSGMPFIGHSVLLGFALTIGFVIAFLAIKKITRRLMAMIVISIMVIFTGYSSYALLLIRATAETPMNQNAPDNVFALSSYLNREQYGDRPLFLGPTFAEALEEIEYPEGSGQYYVTINENGYPKTRTLDGYLRSTSGGAVNTPEYIYSKVVKQSPEEPDKYVKEIERPNYKTMSDLNMVLTRMYSSDASHVQGYKSWSGYRIKDFDNIPASVRQQWAQQGYVSRVELVRYLNDVRPVTTHQGEDGESDVQELAWKPGFGDNVSYFVNYQLNHMYWRYFMWNFAGRQNDLQGNGEPHLGNWISGISAIDNARLGNQEMLPDEFGAGNKGNNVYYMLPLLLGVFGLLMQALWRGWANDGRGIEQFWVVFFLFFMTGIAIVLYLNQTPGQPRERDYAFAGSFYAFTIWMGIAIPAIAMLIEKAVKGKSGRYVAGGVACVVAIGIPLQMVGQTWDDHDRSDRYTTRDFGANYLNSLDPNAVIFTNGDNDTFPLWYSQEVEGVRTDVRVVNLSYLTTDWYANQMIYPTYEAEAIPMLATPSDWSYEQLSYSFVVPSNTVPTNVFDGLRQLYESDAKRYGAHYITSTNLQIPVDRQVAAERYKSPDPMVDSLYLLPYISNVNVDLQRQGSGLNQSKVLSLDIIANSINDGWKRPTYFATTVPSRYYLGLTPYMSATGLANEVTGVRQNSPYNVTAQKSFANILNTWKWGGLDDSSAEIYLDETVRRMVASVRSGVFTIAENLVQLPGVKASQAAIDAAIAAGYEAPANQGDMGRILLDVIRTKLPVSRSPYDGMMGLYMASTYLDLYLATGNESDLAAAYELSTTEAERYAGYIAYGASLEPINLRSVIRAEGYAMCYLSEAVAIANRCELFKADPSLRTNEEVADDVAAVCNLAVQDDFIISPMAYINGYTIEELEGELPNYGAEDQQTIGRAIALLRLHKYTGVEPMKLSNEIMGRHGFTAEQWNHVHNASYVH